MRKFVLHFCAGLSLIVLWAARAEDDGVTRSRNPADFKFWSQPIDGITLGICVSPLATAQLPDNSAIFRILLKNGSKLSKYTFFTGGQYGCCRLKILDQTGKNYPLRDQPPNATPSVVTITAGEQQFGYVFVSLFDLKAIGNNRLVVNVDLYDTPTKPDAKTKPIILESAPFQIYPFGPAQTPLPDDPVLAQWKIEEQRLVDAIDHAAGPNDRSSAASQLASFYLRYFQDFDKAEALLPKITDPGDNFDTQVMLICQNPAFTDAQRTESLEALAVTCPSGRLQMLERLIGTYHYAATHPSK